MGRIFFHHSFPIERIFQLIFLQEVNSNLWLHLPLAHFLLIYFTSLAVCVCVCGVCVCVSVGDYASRWLVDIAFAISMHRVGALYITASCTKVVLNYFTKLDTISHYKM